MYSLGGGRYVIFIVMMMMSAFFHQCQSQDPNNVPFLMETIIDKLLEITATLADVQRRIGNLEDQSQGSREQIEDFRNMFTRDECKENSHNCSHFAACNDHMVNYDCTCLQGFSGDGFSCADIDECQENSHQCAHEATCVNVAGSYQCVCQEGFLWEGNACTDINECELELHTCGLNATCKNGNGNYACECNRYFYWNGQSCEGPGCEWPFSLLKGVGCIYLANQKMPWDQAKIHCESLGGMLYEPETDSEYLALTNHLALTNQYNFIIAGVKGKKWTTSGRDVATQLWRTGDAHMGESGCGFMLKRNSYLLANYECSAAEQFLCKLQM